MPVLYLPDGRVVRIEDGSGLRRCECPCDQHAELARGVCTGYAATTVQYGVPADTERGVELVEFAVCTPCLAVLEALTLQRLRQTHR